ncbi:uncharacterized protein LOC127123030 [Lathyrus oleraceus]|uniref:uncharacterized protein LOC127123030 n=1 Tax=Pisum sativum TaxID=3888 RepID=UPI0021D1D573|nr:uncharacterized protein LOC127123030 [Pisum sativum]
MREPSEKSKKAKKAKLGESSGSRPPVPLAGSPDTGIRFQERLAREAKEQARKEAEEKERQEELHRIREAEAKDVADAAAAEAEAKAKADAEEATRIAEEAASKANADKLTQGEHSNSGFVPLVLKTLEELQKKQQVQVKDPKDSMRESREI